MSKTFSTAALFIFLFSFSTLAGTTPDAVLKAFKKKFPDAKEVNWVRQNMVEYQAAFTLGGIKMRANFKQDGSWTETDTRIEEKDLPAVVVESVHKNKPGLAMQRLLKIEYADGLTEYQIEILDIPYLYAADGKFIGVVDDFGEW